jgi:hypothetical protein
VVVFLLLVDCPLIASSTVELLVWSCSPWCDPLDVVAHQIKAPIKGTFEAHESVVHFLILPAISSNWTATSSGLCCLLIIVATL